MENTNSVFAVLNSVDCSEHVETKNGLSYLSWAWAWGIAKKYYPNATYTVYETELPTGYTANYFTDGRTCWVKTGVTIDGIEYIEELPVMDFKNKSILLEQVTSFDVNKAIQRSLTKALARHGLGLYIYAGEDLPEAPFVKPTEEHIKQLEEVGGSLDKLVAYCKVKSVNDITDDMVVAIINKKRGTK